MSCGLKKKPTRGQNRCKGHYTGSYVLVFLNRLDGDFRAVSLIKKRLKGKESERERGERGDGRTNRQ